MRNNYKSYILFILCCFLTVATYAQEAKDTIEGPKDTSTEKTGLLNKISNYFKEANKDKSHEGFDVTVLGGPSYSKDSKFSLGLAASGLYRVDKKELDLQPSKASLFGSVSTTGFFTVGLRNTTYFPEDRYRIDTEVRLFYNPTQYYGIGFEQNDQDRYTEYNDLSVVYKADFLKKVWKHTFAGLTLDGNIIKGTNFENRDLKPDEATSTSTFGAGVVAGYDSRDYSTVPHKGMFLKYRQVFYPAFIGNTPFYGRVDFTASFFQKVWETAILAYNLDGTFMNGDVPWTNMATFGGSHTMRGYLRGRYRDKKQINTTLELRQKIFKRVGVTAWGGAGKVFHSFSDWEWHHILPNYGVGLRWEFKHRVNLRLDYGIGKRQSGFYFNISEAF